MLYGLYLSAQGAENQSLRLETIANNVANADTTAFKRDLAVFQDHPPFDVQHGYMTHPPGNLNESTGGTTIAMTQTDFGEGPLQETGGAYDLAITGLGFFQVRNGSENLLTRNGQFTVNNLGEIITQDQGLPVLSRDGTSIIVPPFIENLNINADGNIVGMMKDGGVVPLGQLDLVQPASLDDLQKLGTSLYRSSGPVLPAEPSVQVRQGFLEASGVNPIAETVQMIEASRAFETNINMIRTQDETLSRLLQSMSRR